MNILPWSAEASQINDNWAHIEILLSAIKENVPAMWDAFAEAERLETKAKDDITS